MYVENAAHEGSTVPLGEKAVTASSQLVGLVLAKIKTDPYESDGQTWCTIDREAHASALGVSLSTFNKIIGAKPFVYDVIKSDGKKITLLRVGDKIRTQRNCAKIMEYVWKTEIKKFNAAKAVRDTAHAHKILHHDIKGCEEDLSMAHADGNTKGIKVFSAELNKLKLAHTKRIKKAAQAEADAKVTPVNNPIRFGCFAGLADIWGFEAAPKVLRYIIHHWDDFMSAVKLAIANDDSNEKDEGRYYEYPLVTLMRRYPNAIYEVFQTELQSSQPGKLEKLKKNSKDNASFLNALVVAVQKSKAYSS